MCDWGNVYDSILMHIIIIKCSSIMNIIIMYQNIITVHFQVYMNNFPFTKEEIILNKSIYFKCNCFLEIS